MVRLIVYVLYYNDESRQRAEADFGGLPWCRLLFLPTTRYFEGYAFMELLAPLRAEWQDADFVGTLSHKARSKCAVPADLPDRLEGARRAGIEMVSLYDAGGAAPVQTGCSFHPNFMNAWRPLLRALGLAPAPGDPPLPPVYCNYWVATPAVMDACVAMHREARAAIATNGYLDVLMDECAGYPVQPSQEYREATGKNYYVLCPFLLERLAGVLAARCRHVHLRALPPL